MVDQRHAAADKAVAGLFGMSAFVGVGVGVGLAIWRAAGGPAPASEFSWPVAHPVVSGLAVGAAAFVVFALAAIVHAIERRP